MGDGKDVYEVVANCRDNSREVTLDITIFQNKSALGALSPYSNGKVFYFIDENIFEIYNKTLGKTSVTTNYKAYLGRENIKFQYVHAADDTSRIDPSASNIIDTYISSISVASKSRQTSTDSTLTHITSPS